MNMKLNRRDFLKVATIGLGSTALAACQAKTIKETVVVKETVQSAPEKVVETVVVKETVESKVEVEVEKTKIVEVEKPVEVTKVIEKQVGDVVVTVTLNGNLLSEADAITEAMLFTVFLMDYNLKKKGSGVSVRYEAWPGGDDYNTKVRLMTASGELGDTVLWGNWGSLPNYVDDNILLPLDDLMAAANVKLDEWVPSAQELMKYDPAAKKPGAGQVWGLPIMGNPGACFLFSNLDVLKAAGLSAPTDATTLEELTAMAGEVKNKVGVFGIQENLWGTTHGFGWDQGYVAPFGGHIFDEEGKKSLINSDQCQQAYMWQYNLRHVDKYEGTPDDVSAYGNYKEGTEKGKVAMYKMGAWGAGWFLLRPANENPEMGFSLFPSSWNGNADGRRGNTLGLNWYGVSANAEHPAACFDVLYWINSKDAGLFAIESGQTLPAPRDDVLKDPLLDNYPVVKSSGDAIFGSEKERIPANLRNQEVGDILTQAMTLVDTGAQVPDKAFLDKLAADMQAVLDLPPA